MLVPKLFTKLLWAICFWNIRKKIGLMSTVNMTLKGRHHSEASKNKQSYGFFFGIWAYISTIIIYYCIKKIQNGVENEACKSLQKTSIARRCLQTYRLSETKKQERH